jgi:hypothetical protein
MPTKRSLPRVTPKQFVAERNDEVRNALTLIGRHVLPCVDPKDFYYSDLMHDAMHMADMTDEQTSYLFVTECGTHMYAAFDHVVSAIRTVRCRGLFKITCTAPKRRYLDRTWRIRPMDGAVAD